MSSWLNTQFHWYKRSLIPAGISRQHAIAAFRNHEFLIQSDTDLIQYKVDVTPWPDADRLAADKTVKYSMTANAQILPKIISNGSAIAYRTYLSELDNGVAWGVTSSFGVNQVAHWTVEAATQQDLDEAGESGSLANRWAAVQDVKLDCSRLVMPSVKAKVTNEWKEAHLRFHNRMREIQEGKA